MPEIRKSICPQSRKEWRDWLRRNHRKEKEIFLIHWKRHTGKPFLSHRETMEEAICWGWIDTTIRSLDADRFGRFFRKRNDKSQWSKSTLKYARQMIREKKMTAAGLAAYKAGLKRPLIDLAIPQKLSMSPEFKKAVANNRKAAAHFEKLAPSYRKLYTHWVESAKRPETRKKRIREAVKRLAANKKNILG